MGENKRKRSKKMCNIGGNIVDQRLNDMLGEHTIPAVVVDWEAVTSLSEDSELDMEMNNLDPEGTLGDLSEMELNE